MLRISLISEEKKAPGACTHAHRSGKSFLSLEGTSIKPFFFSKEANRRTREVATKYFSNVWWSKWVQRLCKLFARYIKSICPLCCVTQKYFSECTGQQRILEMPNTFRNNILLLLGSLEFRLHNTECYERHLAVPVEDPSFLFKKRKQTQTFSFLVFTSQVLIQFGLYFFHHEVCINILNRCGILSSVFIIWMTGLNIYSKVSVGTCRSKVGM